MSVTSKAKKILPLSIYSVLKGEHAEVKGLFMILKAEPDSMQESREKIFDKLRRELLSHAIAESITVYAPVKKQIDDKSLIDESEAEHAEVENLLEELSKMEPDGQGWKAKVEELEQKVLQHTNEEETELFDEMQEYLSDEEAKAMGDDFQKAKEEEMNKLKA